MKKFVLVATLLFATTSFADGFTNDWFTSCSDGKTVNTKPVSIDGKTFTLDLVMPGSGISVFLGKDVELADFVKKEVFGSQCSGLSQGMGTQIICASNCPANPYSVIFNENRDNKNVLRQKALGILIQVNGGAARTLLQSKLQQ